MVTVQQGAHHLPSGRVFIRRNLLMIDEKKLIKDIKEYHLKLNPRYISKLVDAEILDIIDIINEQPKIDIIKEQPKFSEWIPCSEHLPKEKGEYLVTCDDGSICKWWFVIEDDLKLWATRPYSCKPIAWMPLPSPYNK